MTVDVQSVLARYRDAVERAMLQALPAAEAGPSRLREAMRYSLDAPGKRIRPALCFAACEAAGGGTSRADAPAAALELVHTYSLVHDDLPCMDDDDTRRGRPTNHVVYGEAVAVLAGDALLTRAFGVLGGAAELPEAVRAAMVVTLARAAGEAGMVGGQALDLAAEGHDVDAAALREIHARKTGALFEASCRLGALAAEAPADRVEALGRFGERLGLAFQIADDLLDETGSSASLGKAAGKDRERGKATYPVLFGLEESRRLLREAAEAAERALAPFGPAAGPLLRIARFVVERSC